MSSQVQIINDTQFESDVLVSKIPLIVHCSSSSSPACRPLRSYLERAATEFQGIARFVELDVEKNPRTPARYGVSTIPELLMFSGGSLKTRTAGLIAKGQLSSWIACNI
jgi:thioredoxin 1